MEFRLLGPVGVWAAGQPVRVGGRRERTMLAVLLLAGGRLVPIEKMIDSVWGDAPPVTARRQVHTGVSELRRVLGEILVTREPGYLLAVQPEAVDLHAFEASVGSARQAVADGRPADASAAFEAALRLWRGPALGGVSGLTGEAARLEERRLAVLAERIDVDLTLGRHADLVGELSALVAEHPLRERFAAQLMLTLYRCGRAPDALEVYQEARRALADGLGLEPRGELRRLAHAMLTGDPRLDLVSQPAAATPCLLPADVADFTGRDAEADRLRVALGAADGTAVVVSAVSGRGGVGKTALAVHVAHRLRDAFPDGQLYVNLHSGQTESAEVLGRFLRALGVDGTAIPQDLDERAELYRGRLAGHRVLVLLDNAGDEAQVLPLLPGSPSCAVLVTSRARLGGLPGALVELDVLDHEHALALLGRIVGVARVAAEPGAAAELVGLCGRLPLAVRIAGARLAARPHWQLAELVARLTDERGRLDELSHGGLAVRASLELSFRGLDAGARTLFRRLGLLDAPDFAAWVGAALLDTPVGRARELTERLVDARLLEVVGRDACGVTRFRFHDLVRGYARERAELEEDAATRRAALARAFGAWLAKAEAAHRAVYGGDYVIIHGTAARWLPDDPSPDGDPLTWLETERLGIVAAVRQAAEHDLDELAWDLSGSFVALFATRWYLDDWRLTIDDALAVTRRTGNRRGEAATLYCQASLLDARGAYEQAMSVVDRALRLFDEVGERHGHGLALVHASHLARRLGRFDFALDTAERGRVALHEVGDRAAEASGVRSLAQTQLALGQFDLVRRHLDEALAILSQANNPRDVAQVLYSVGELNLARGMLEAAVDVFDQVLAIVVELRDRVGEAHARHGLGACYLRQGRHADAETELGRALRIARDAGLRFVEARLLGDLAELAHARGRPEDATVLVGQAVELWRVLKAPLWQARALRLLGDVRVAAGDQDAAAEARAAATALFAELGAPESSQ